VWSSAKTASVVIWTEQKNTKAEEKTIMICSVENVFFECLMKCLFYFSVITLDVCLTSTLSHLVILDV